MSDDCMCQGLGRHRRAAQLLRDALDASTSPDAIIECLHLRGVPLYLTMSFPVTVSAVQRYTQVLRSIQRLLYPSPDVPR